ncbi:MAG: anaerobic ribonucleoside triphosphate reductase, partial [Bacteroidales bacterium]|nr:anaerobic ribonucleoside triphosphate reductase [Bacteroidales bacterium]
MIIKIQKRDGRLVEYDRSKIQTAIYKAMQSDGLDNNQECGTLSEIVEKILQNQYVNDIPNVENVQDIVEQVLMDSKYGSVAKKYITYRAQRSKAREMNTNLMRILDELTNTSASDSDLKRDNANIDGDTAMGIMLKYGSESAKYYYQKFILDEDIAKAHIEGDIHIHDLDFYTLTTTCCQLDIAKLFKGGFSTGHGFLREPNDIRSYAALACIAIQANQNDQHGGQSIPSFDFGLAMGVTKTYKKLYIQNIIKTASILNALNGSEQQIKDTYKQIEDTTGLFPSLASSNEFARVEREKLINLIDEKQFDAVKLIASKYALEETDKNTFQAMEALIHNLNTMHSRAGAQVPFSSINYGTDTSEEGRMITKNVLLATEAGLGMGETPIFPIQIFKVKEGVNYNPEDPNYDLFHLACKVSAKRLFPNFSFIDAPYNKKYYVPGRPETEVVYMGCRTRVIANVYDPSRETVYGRGNLSFTSINLPRLAIESQGNLSTFFEKLNTELELVVRQMLHRFKIQCRKKVKNFPFLMGQGLWLDSDKLGFDDEVGDILKHGTLSIGFIGLAETLISLTGKHHGESEDSQQLGLRIIKFMRDFVDAKSQEMKLNFTLLATPAEGISGRFTGLDEKKFGIIKGITDKEYYTNSFHIPVNYKISACDKIKLEAPYHALTNAGHITYVELDGD